MYDIIQFISCIIILENLNDFNANTHKNILTSISVKILHINYKDIDVFHNCMVNNFFSIQILSYKNTYISVFFIYNNLLFYILLLND